MLELILQAVVEVLGWGTAKLLLPVVSFGRCYVGDTSSGRPGHSRPVWSRDAAGNLRIDDEPAVLIGLAFWAILAATAAVVLLI